MLEDARARDREAALEQRRMDQREAEALRAEDRARHDAQRAADACKFGGIHALYSIGYNADGSVPHARLIIICLFRQYSSGDFSIPDNNQRTRPTPFNLRSTRLLDAGGHDLEVLSHR